MVLDDVVEALINTIDGGGDFISDYDWSTFEFGDDEYALADIFEELLSNGEYMEIGDVLSGFEEQTMEELREVLGDEEFEELTRGTQFSHY